LASLDFEREKRHFYSYYDTHLALHVAAADAFVLAIDKLLHAAAIGEITKIESRIKSKEECIRKFQRKYQRDFEAAEQPYRIGACITDLIGIRIVCLYEDQTPLVADALRQLFRVIEVTDKSAVIEASEDLLGYKGLHLDLVAGETLLLQPEYQAFAGLGFEVQVRSLIQDTWSILDHKIKYKKAIPGDLKRRINLLSALFELADREFRDIRNATQALLCQEPAEAADEPAAVGGRGITAFSFLRVAGHFFRDFAFEDSKVDNFVQEILRLHPVCRRADLHHCLLENLKLVREYRDDFIAENPESTFSPYTMIRHCLFRFDRQLFSRMLSRSPRQRFELWEQRRTDAPS